MSTQGMEPFNRLMDRAAATSLARQRAGRIRELVSQIDELSGEMGSSDFREAVRAHGYDIDACTATLDRRGVQINN